MPRSTIAQRRAVGFDKNLMLRDYTAAAISATTAEAAIGLDLVAYDELVCVINVAAYTGYVANTAVWGVYIEGSADGTNYQTLAYCQLDGGKAAQFDVPLGGLYANEYFSFVNQNSPIYIRARAIKNGTPGNLTYGAYLGTLADS